MLTPLGRIYLLPCRTMRGEGAEGITNQRNSNSGMLLWRRPSTLTRTLWKMRTKGGSRSGIAYCSQVVPRMTTVVQAEDW
jgi:hypothetical protein